MIKRQPFHVLCLIVATSLITGCGSSSGGDGNDPAGASPSTSASANAGAVAITGVTFDYRSHRRLATGSDNWPTTWSDDDQQYSMWGDGGGFGGTEDEGRASFGVARIEGTADDYRGINRYGGVNGECRSVIDGKSHGAPISIGGVLYAWVTPESGPIAYNVFTLYSSGDKGCTWTQRNVRFDRASQGISFGSFVQFGKDNGAARDDYVYTVAVEVTNADSINIVQRPGRIILLRVPQASIENRGAYEFYAGQDAADQPTWSSNSADRFAIYEDTDGVGPFAQLIYVQELKRFIYTNQHGNGVDVSAMQSLLTMAEAPQPWGPWHVIFHDVFFPQDERTIFQWNFAPKWFRNGGRDFTLIFSGTESNDSWNTVDGRFELGQ